MLSVAVTSIQFIHMVLVNVSRNAEQKKKKSGGQEGDENKTEALLWV